ncbi:hypothetical protein Emed_004914 [Eimeria media]
MGEALRVPSHSIQTREPSSVSPSPFLSPENEASPQELGLTSYNRRLRCRGGFGFKSALAVVASAAAVAVLISLCAATYLRAPPLQLTSRSLSERETLKSPAGSSACGETSGNGSGDDSGASLQEEELGPSPAKKAKVEEEGSEEDAEAAFILQTSVSRLEESASAGGAVTTAPESPSASVLHFSIEEVMAAQGLMALRGGLGSVSQQQAAPGAAFEPQVQLPSVAQQQAAPPPPRARFPPSTLLAAVTVSEPTMESTLSSVPSTSAGRELEQPEPAPLQLAELGREASEDSPEELFEEDLPKLPFGSRAVLLYSNQGLETIDPLAEWEPPSASEARGLPIIEHAFSRLPQVPGGDTSAYSTFFSPERALRKKITRKVTVSWFQKLSALLARKELSRSDLRQMGMLVERFVTHLHLHESAEIHHFPSFAVETLGLRFLIMDMIVSSLQLLGVSLSDPWWAQLVSRIPDEYTRPFMKWDSPLPVFNYNLMVRLTQAIRILKGGQRPPPALLVHLKRCLFCSRSSPLRFTKPSWDSWREANRRFYQQFEGTSGQSDPEQPGPSNQSSS